MRIIKNIDRIDIPVICMENEDDMYEGKYTDTFIDNIKCCKCFIDVGANFGYYSLLAAQLMSKDSIIYTFEPVPIKFESLKQNTKTSYELNKIEIKCFNIAVSNEEKNNVIMYLPDNEKDCSSSLIKNRNHNNKAILVNTNTLDNLCKDIDVDFIKIDVEGAELEVLRGAINILKNKRPILMIEIHKFTSLDIYNLFKLLYDNNYYSIKYASQWYFFIPIEKIQNEFNTRN